ncbi:pre-mRNA-splicing factor 18 [Leptopilina boulardi]|uniref:pre-mRNA-splicing factor 18 n=1 Tax=Leptopilina boulardi TaxID=63433 RepID=UPI0021F67248|nr:pre-mRNA-splicing factor 18 [Leptopilina boulardi]
MDALKAEIQRKRKELEEKKLLCGKKKYFKKSDFLSNNDEKLQTNGVNSDKLLSVKSEEKVGVEETNEHLTLPRNEVIRRLRERGEPILLFAETEQDAFKRLRKCEILEPEVNKGFRNDFQEAMEQVDLAYVNEILAPLKPGSNGSKVDVNILDGSVITYEDLQQKSIKLNRGDREYDMNVITQFLQYLVQMWGNQLNSRCAAEKMGTRGKMASATYAQTREYIKPLLRKLQNKSLTEDITDSLTEIVKHLLERNYILASDAYLQMAIGNSPWPIGVTMVGIHARTGREKIFSKNVAHVMNDETQRKYIQALKRLMTKCQEYYPTDPSRCVEFSKI